MAISILILFYEIGDIAQNHKIHLPLLDVDIDTSATNAFLHIALFYFLWRYLIAFRDVGGLRHTTQVIRQTVSDKMDRSASRKAFSFINKEQPKGWNNRLTLSRDTTPRAIDKNYNMLTKKGGVYRFRTPALIGTTIPYISITGCELFRIKISSFFMHFFKTNLFLEHYLPFVLFVLALLETLDVHIAHNILFKIFNW